MAGDKPHSQTVRGTLDNPKTKEAMEKGSGANRSQLGDHVSLRAETSNTEPTEADRGAAPASKGVQDQAKSRPERGDEDGQGRDRLYETKKGKLGDSKL